MNSAPKHPATLVRCFLAARRCRQLDSKNLSRTKPQFFAVLLDPHTEQVKPRPDEVWTGQPASRLRVQGDLWGTGRPRSGLGLVPELVAERRDVGAHLGRRLVLVLADEAEQRPGVVVEHVLGVDAPR
jgi:hypothetical protein